MRGTVMATELAHNQWVVKDLVSSILTPATIKKEIMKCKYCERTIEKKMVTKYGCIWCDSYYWYKLSRILTKGGE